jgi:hypothetical protein
MTTVAQKIQNFKDHAQKNGLKLSIVTDGLFGDLKINADGQFAFEDGSVVPVPEEGVDVNYTRIHFAGCTIMNENDISIRNKGRETNAKNSVPRHRPALVRFLKKDDSQNQLSWSERGQGRPELVCNLLAEVIAPYQHDAETDEDIYVHKLTSCAFSIELPTPGGQSYVAEAAEGRSVSPKDFVWGVRNINRKLNLRLAQMDSNICHMLVGADAKESAVLPSLGVRLVAGDPRFAEPILLDAEKGIADMFSAKPDARIRVSDVRLFSVPTEWQLVQKGWLSHVDGGRYLLTPKNRKHAMSRVPGTSFIKASEVA